MQLSEHFTLGEFIKSQTASRLGLDNTPGNLAKESLRFWCHMIGEPVRKHFDAPVVITSGFRSTEVNKAIGGTEKSQHGKGEAADFEVVGYSNLEVASWIKESLKFDQLILEFWDGIDPYSGWVHCSIKIKTSIMRGEVLQAIVLNTGNIKYIRGLPVS